MGKIRDIKSWTAPARGPERQTARLAADVEACLRQAGARKIEKRGNEILCLCPSPAHNDRRVGSFSIHSAPHEKKNGLGFCWACHWSGDIIDVVALLAGIRQNAALSLVSKNAVMKSKLDDGTLPEEKERGVGLDWPPVLDIIPETACFEYLKGRGFGIDEIARFGLQDWRQACRVVVPLDTESRRGASYVARLYRSPRGREPKAITPTGCAETKASFFGLSLVNRAFQYATLVEGWAHVLRCWQARLPNPIGSGGNRLGWRRASALGWVKKLLVIADNDENKAGLNLVDEVKGWLDCEVHVIVCPDVGKDAADYDPEFLRRMVNESGW